MRRGGGRTRRRRSWRGGCTGVSALPAPRRRRRPAAVAHAVGVGALRFAFAVLQAASLRRSAGHRLKRVSRTLAPAPPVCCSRCQPAAPGPPRGRPGPPCSNTGPFSGPPPSPPLAPRAGRRRLQHRPTQQALYDRLNRELTDRDADEAELARARQERIQDLIRSEGGQAGASEFVERCAAAGRSCGSELGRGGQHG